MPTPPPPQPSRLHIGQRGYIDPRLFEDFPAFLMPFEEIPNEILELFDDWGQSIPINVEVLLGEVDLLGVVVLDPRPCQYSRSIVGFLRSPRGGGRRT